MASWGDYTHSTGWIFQDYGEEDWWTNAAGIAQTKTFLSYAKSVGYDYWSIRIWLVC